MIVHFDIDAFYASIAQRDDPTLRGKPVAVAGDSRRAVILTASYEARAFGVRSAIPLYRALELCRELIIVAPDFVRYREASQAVFAIFSQGAKAIEGLSLDEAYIDLEAQTEDDAILYARDARRKVREEVGLAVSVGIARQKLLAKIASDDAKPDGLRVVKPGSEAEYLHMLPVGRLWGIGPKTEARLALAGITLIGQLAELDDEAAFALFGRQGREFREAARGNDERIVEIDREMRSLSSETTFERNLRSADDVRTHLGELCDDVAHRLRMHNLRAQTIGVKIKRADFRVFTRQTTLAEPIDSAEMIRAAAWQCLRRYDVSSGSIRLLGVRAGSLIQEDSVQMSLSEVG